MIGFQPYETFKLLIDTGGPDRANTLLVAACDAYVRRPAPMPSEVEQFEALATRLFKTATPAARAKAAATLGLAEHLSPALEALVIDNLGEDLMDYLLAARALSDEAIDKVLAGEDVQLCATIGRRPDLTNVTLTKLFRMNSRKVYRALATNMTIKPQGAFRNALARSAQMDHQVAWSLAARDDFDAALLAPAFFDLQEMDRIKVIQAFCGRPTPDAPIKKTLEQIMVANAELTKALMKLFSQNRRPEVTRLLTQITGLDEVRCGQIAHDVSGAALFVVLRAFGCTGYDGLKVIIHATSHDEDKSRSLSEYASLFQSVSADAMAYLLSVWRADVNLLDMTKHEYRPLAERRRLTQKRAADPVIGQTIEALERIGTRRAS